MDTYVLCAVIYESDEYVESCILLARVKIPWLIKNSSFPSLWALNERI